MLRKWLFISTLRGERGRPYQHGRNRTGWPLLRVYVVVVLYSEDQMRKAVETFSHVLADGLL
jgi:hypothetical protein